MYFKLGNEADVVLNHDGTHRASTVSTAEKC